MTLMQEYTMVQKVAEGIVPSMHAIYNVVNKKSEDGWEERALSLAINFSPPDNWRSPSEQQRGFSKGLNRNWALGSKKKIALVQKTTLSGRRGTKGLRV